MTLTFFIASSTILETRTPFVAYKIYEKSGQAAPMLHFCCPFFREVVRMLVHIGIPL